jgi:SAM-dependent methyltransferase
LKNEKQFYEDYWESPAYQPEQDPTTPARKRLLLEFLAKNIPAKSPVLDLGCGDGYFCKIIQDSGYRAVGVDISGNALQKARSRFSGIDFRMWQPDSAVPAGDGEFSAVWSSEVVEHVFDVHGYLSEVNRALKPGGLFILTTPYHGVVKNILVAAIKFDRHFAPDGEHIRFFSKTGLQRCLLNASFKPEFWTGIGRMWPLYRTWFVVARKTSAPAAGAAPG